MLLLGALMPHPPLLVPDVGKEQIAKVRATAEAMQKLAAEIKGLQPETIIIFSPHGPVFSDGMAIRGGELVLRGHLRRFGSAREFVRRVDGELAEAVAREAVAAGIYTMVMDEAALQRHGIDPLLDHGVLVPLSFLDEVDAAVVAMGMAFMPRLQLMEFGRAVARAIEKVGRRTVVIASGDLSHCLTHDAPVPYNPNGEKLDREIMACLKDADFGRLARLDPELQEKGAECGYRTLLMLAGVLDGRWVEANCLSYEGPYGVGYGVVSLRPGPAGSAPSCYEQLVVEEKAAMAQRRAQESPLVRLARYTVESRALGLPPKEVADLPPVARERAGVFVSIKKHGELRGCIGTIQPVQANVAEEIRANAISAAFRDPRFDPVEPEELNDLVYSVDVLTPPEPVASLAELDPKVYGVIVRQNGRSGLLLPDLPGIDTAEEQVAIARRKAGIPADSPVQLERFRVVRYY
ncbi:MAG: AmmeMemoRadiSam system protein A [Bacillota bacterium]|jgi:AmmeMemoRadiSam system protein A